MAAPKSRKAAAPARITSGTRNIAASEDDLFDCESGSRDASTGYALGHAGVAACGAMRRKSRSSAGLPVRSVRADDPHRVRRAAVREAAGAGAELCSSSTETKEPALEG